MKFIKQIITIILITLSSFITYSQDFNWNKCYGGNDNDYPQAIARYDSSIYITGNSYSDSITFENETLYAYRDMFITKLDLFGNVKWTKKFGNSEYTTCLDITNDSEGFIYVVGQYFGYSVMFDSIELINSYYNDYDMFITKLDSFGNVIWAKSYGGTGQDQCTSIVTDKNDNVIITGIFDSPEINFDTISFNNTGESYDIFVAKFKNDGTFDWAKTIIGNEADYVHSINVDIDNNIYIVGGYTSQSLNTGNNFVSNTGNYDAFLIKYNPNGEDDFIQTVEGQFRQEAQDVLIDSARNITICGLFNGYDTDFGNGFTFDSDLNENDSYLAKYDSIGNIINVKIISGNGQDEIESIDFDIEQNICAIGWFNSDSIVFDNMIIYNFDNANNPDIFLLKYDNSLNFEAAYAYGGTEWDIGKDICVDGHSNAIIISSFSSQDLMINGYTIPNQGYNDILVSSILTSNINNIQMLSKKDNQINIFPNPTSTYITIKANKIQSIKVTNINGEEIYCGTDNEINCTSFSNGIYFINVTTSKQTFTRKFIKH